MYFASVIFDPYLTMNFRLSDLNWEFDFQLLTIDIGASDEILVDDPIWTFLDNLCQIIYYLPAFNRNPNPTQIDNVLSIIETTLCWVQKQLEVGLLKLKSILAEIKYPPAPQILQYTPCSATKTLHFGQQDLWSNPLCGWIH